MSSEGGDGSTGNSSAVVEGTAEGLVSELVWWDEEEAGAEEDENPEYEQVAAKSVIRLNALLELEEEECKAFSSLLPSVLNKSFPGHGSSLFKDLPRLAPISEDGDFLQVALIRRPSSAPPDLNRSSFVSSSPRQDRNNTLSSVPPDLNGNSSSPADLNENSSAAPNLNENPSSPAPDSNNSSSSAAPDQNENPSDVNDNSASAPPDFNDNPVSDPPDLNENSISASPDLNDNPVSASAGLSNNNNEEHDEEWWSNQASGYSGGAVEGLGGGGQSQEAKENEDDEEDQEDDDGDDDWEDMGEIRSEYKLKSPPDDGISTVRFSPNNPQYLGASSWDSNVRIYDVQSSNIRHKYSPNGKPLLDFVFDKDGTDIFSGGLDGEIFSYNLNSENVSVVGNHNDAVRCVDYSVERELLVSGSWDSSIKMWDKRTSGPVCISNQMEEVYNISVKDEVLIVGTSGRKIIVWDIRNMVEPTQQRDSLLKYQTRCLKIFPNKQGYVLSSIEGRVAVEYFDQSAEVQKKKYAFKCHRIKENNVENIFPVNAISFHEEYSTFATGGSDGYVNVWDGFNKKRLCQFHKYPTGIASLAFSSCGTMLAIACSFLHETEECPTPLPENSIFIRTVTDQETKPK